MLCTQASARSRASPGGFVRVHKTMPTNAMQAAAAPAAAAAPPPLAADIQYIPENGESGGNGVK